jgi:hypothetical protein
MLVFWLVSKVCAIYYHFQIKDLLLLLNPSLSAAPDRSNTNAGFWKQSQEHVSLTIVTVRLGGRRALAMLAKRCGRIIRREYVAPKARDQGTCN